MIVLQITEKAARRKRSHEVRTRDGNLGFLVIRSSYATAEANSDEFSPKAVWLWREMQLGAWPTKVSEGWQKGRLDYIQWKMSGMGSKWQMLCWLEMSLCFKSYGGDRKRGWKERTHTYNRPLLKALTATLNDDENRTGVFNVVTSKEKLDLSRRITKTNKADKYTEWLEKDSRELDKVFHKKKDEESDEMGENRARYIEPPFRPSEKRRLYFGPETPILAPLTTQGKPSISSIMHWVRSTS